MTPEECYERFTGLLDPTRSRSNGTDGMWRCPAHPDDKPSLSVKQAEDRLLVYCHAGCKADKVVEAAGARITDLFYEPRVKAETQRRREVARYTYTDEDGVPLFDAVRYEPKDFRQHPPGRSRGGIGGIRRVLYHLPELIAADPRDVVFIVEGEKDVHAIEAAGGIASCNPMGAGNWDSVADLARNVLQGRIVVVVADKDTPGHRHAAAIRSSLEGVAASVVVVEATIGKDAADHLGAGRRLDEFQPVDIEGIEEVNGERSSFEPIPLDQFLDGDFVRMVPTILTASNTGAAYLYAGHLNELHADSGVGKSWIAALIIKQTVESGDAIMLVDLEDTAATLIDRLRSLQVDDELIGRLVVYTRPQDPFDPHQVDLLIEHALKRGVAHVIVDSLGEAFGLDGIDEASDFAVAPWIRRVLRRVNEETGATVTWLDHITKSADNPLHPSGSKRKRAAVTGASYYVTAVNPLVRGRGGRLELTVGKDRHGYHRKGEKVAAINMSCFADGTVEMEVVSMTNDDGTTSEELIIMRSLVKTAREALEDPARGEWMSTNTLLSESRNGGMRAKDSRVRQAIEAACARGALERRDGPRHAVEYRWRQNLPDTHG